MKASVEISFYPLRGDYTKHIFDFIERIHQYDFTVKTNGMSTQIFGDYDVIMRALSEEMKTSLEQGDTNVFVMKLINGELSDY